MLGLNTVLPKVKNADGTNAKDEDGNDKRSETQSDGCIYSFSSNGKLVKIKIVNALLLSC